MTSLERDRVARFSANALRYVLGPFGGLLLSWLVIQFGSLELWGQVVTPMILVQLSVHVLAWGNKDFLLREFSSRGSDVDTLWGEGLRTRGPFILLFFALVLILPAARIVPGWAMLWCSSLFVTNAVEPLIIQRRRFAGAFIADLCGLAVQVALIAGSATLDLSSVCRSLAIGQAVRALLLVPISGADPRAAFVLRRPIRSLRARFRTHVRAAIPFFLIGVSGLLGSRMDLYTLNLIADREQAGTYQVVSGLFLQFQVLPGLIVMPFTRELYRLERASLLRATTRMAGLGALVIIPFLALSWLLFTRVFALDLHWSTYGIGALTIWPSYAYVPVINGLFKRRREKAVVWANFVAAAIMLSLTLMLAPRMGIPGALLAAAAGQWSLLGALLLASRRSRSVHAPAHER